MSNESRRKLLKSIAAGSGTIVAGKSLPESWSRPIVDSVLLPVHAQTSPTSCIITMEVVDVAGAPVPSGTDIVDMNGEYTFSGTVSPAEAGAGEQVTLSWSAPDGSSGQATGIIDASGNWSIGPMLLDYGAVDTATTYVATTGCATTGATWYFTHVST